MTVAAVMDEVVKDTIFYDESGGGVTFSGGEPLMQPEFLMTLLDRCRLLDIHTAVDTTCHANPMIVRNAAGRANLFLCDIKHMDSRRHREFTGKDNRLILENIRLLSDLGKDIIIRIPIVPGFNDDQANIKMTGEFVASLGTVVGIDILPYNKGGTEKAKRLMLQSHGITAATVPDHEELMTIAAALRSDRYEVKIGG
jgi:pyruvate formate lyase activating enzyme